MFSLPSWLSQRLSLRSPACGTGGAAASSRVGGAAKSLVQLNIELDASTPAGNATITLTGPAAAWFGVAFGATEMKQQPAAIIVSEAGHVSEYQLGDHLAGTRLQTQVQSALKHRQATVRAKR